MNRTRPCPPPCILSVDEIIPAIERVIAKEHGVRQTLAGLPTLGIVQFDNCIIPLVEVENRVSGLKAMFGVLRKVSPDAITRQAATEAQRLLSTSRADNVAFRMHRLDG